MAELAVAKRGVEQARQTVDVETQRYNHGRVVISELLDAQALLRERTTRKEIAGIDLVRAKIRIQLALGTLEQQ